MGNLWCVVSYDKSLELWLVNKPLLLLENLLCARWFSHSLRNHSVVCNIVTQTHSVEILVG